VVRLAELITRLGDGLCTILVAVVGRVPSKYYLTPLFDQGHPRFSPILTTPEAAYSMRDAETPMSEAEARRARQLRARGLRGRQFNLTLSDEELEELRSRAAEERLSMATYARRALLGLLKVRAA
jgi:hypothetical protein